MKLNTESVYLEKIGQEIPEQTFKIRASAISFDILSSKLYSNPIRAIVRELACNAYDSHKAAGTENIPFEISVPTSLSPIFVIKDFGTGLSHDEVLNLYTTYFESTKTNSDDYIGQLGLGSKSPFSYSKQFIVESRQNGVCYMYSMFINEEGVPAVSPLGSQPTDEPNGMTITISVKHNDFYRFRQEAEEVLMYFTPYPTVNGPHTRRTFNYRMKKDNWAIREENNSTTPYVIQGFVRYPIDADQLIGYESEEFSLTSEAASLLSAPIDFIVPIGMVQVAPSREHLSYDKKTIENLISYINDVAVDIADSFQSLIDQCPTLWDARVLISSFMDHGSVFRKIYEKLVSRNFKPTYNGIELTAWVSCDGIDITGMIITRYYRIRRSYRRSSRKVEKSSYTQALLDTYKNRGFNEQLFPINSSTTFIYNDARVSDAKIRQYVIDNAKPDHSMIELKAEKKNGDISAKVEEFADFLGMKNTDMFVRTSQLIEDGNIDVSRSVSTREKVDRSMGYVFNNYLGGTYTGIDWSRESIDFNKGGYYVFRNRYTPVVSHESGKDIPAFRTAMRLLSASESIPPSTRVVGVNRQNMKKFIDAPNWINILDVIYKFVMDNKEKIIEYMVMRHTKETTSLYPLSHESVVEIATKLPSTSLFYQVFNPLILASNYGTDYNLMESAKSLIDCWFPLGVEGLVDDIKNQVKLKINSYYDQKVIFSTYPMLTFNTRYSMTPEQVDIVVEYINDVDQKIRNQGALLKSANSFDIVLQPS